MADYREGEIMLDYDPRITILACYATDCIYNLQGGIEPTCSLKLVSHDEYGKCKALKIKLNVGVTHAPPQ